MPLPAAEGLISLYQDAWRDTLAKSSRLQSILNADSEAEAKNKIKRAAGPDEGRPWVLIGDNIELVKDAVQEFVARGPMIAVVEIPINPGSAGETERQLVEFHNDLGQVIDDLKSLVEANTDGVMDLQSMGRQSVDWGHEDDGTEFLFGILVAEVQGI